MWHASPPTVRRPVAALLLACLLGAVVATAPAGWIPRGGQAAAAAATPAANAAAGVPASAAGHVVVVGAAGLRWADVTEEDTPTLADLVRTGSVGTLSVRSAAGVSCPAEGWLTLGAGGYAAAVDPADLDPADGCGARQPPPVASDRPVVPTMPALRDLNDTPRLGARPGTLGEHVPCASAVGPGAALAAADSTGRLAGYAPTLPAEPGELLARCPLTVIDLGSVHGTGTGRRAEARRFDRQLALIRDRQPADAVLIVLGVAETDSRQPRLHVAVAHGPGFGPGWLRSPSTRRLPYVQLADVAPTVLQVLGRPVPEVAGRPLSGGAPGRPDTVAATVAALVDTDSQAVAQRSVMGPFFAGLGVALLLLVTVAGWLLRRRTAPAEVAMRRLGGFALGLSAVPAATFLANLVPWWRSPAPLPTVAAVVAVVATAMTAVAVWASRRAPRRADRVRVRLTALASITVLVFALDALCGGVLQLNSLLGYNPLVAGRFVGFGNVAFAVFGAAAVMLAALLAHRRLPRTAVRWVAAVAVPVVVIDGLPSLGADFGGVLALVPAFVLLGLLAAGARVTWLRLAAAGVGGAALVLLISWLDYLRPADERSHFGRFAGSLLDGTAWQTVHRKLLVSVELLFMGPHTVAGAVLVVVGAALLFRPPGPVRRVYLTWPVVRLGLICVAALAGLGSAVNDSGVAIPVVMGLVVLPTVVALCAWGRLCDAPSPGLPWTVSPPDGAPPASGTAGRRYPVAAPPRPSRPAARR